MSSQHLKVKSSANLLEVVTHLEHLIASLKEGTICLQKGSKMVILKPCDPVTFELEAEVKQDKDALREEISIELKWKKKEAEAQEKEAFVISHEEPTGDIVISNKGPSQDAE